MERHPDLVVAGRFVLEKPLGKGGMGEVWAAKNSSTGRRVALKFLHRDLTQPSHRERLLREARAAGALEHPNVCEVLDIVEHEDQPIMVLELLRGETLADRLERQKVVAAKEAARIGAQVASAVGAAHAHGIVHRDLKPANLFLDQEDRVKVLDFGIAKLVATKGTGETLTATGSVLGTPAYMSPEQALGERSVDHQSDIWSLGIVLYECISGLLPTHAENAGQTIKKIVMRPIQPLAELAPDTPKELLDLIGRMLERRRERRVSDFREVLAVLSAIAGIDCPAVPSPAAASTESGADARKLDDDFSTDRSEDATASLERSASAATPGSTNTRDGASRSIVFPVSPSWSRKLGGVLAVAVAGTGGWFLLRQTAPLEQPPNATGMLFLDESSGQTSTVPPAPEASVKQALPEPAPAPEPVPTPASAGALARRTRAPNESARATPSVSAAVSSHAEALRDRR